MFDSTNVRGEPYLNLSSSWRVYESRPTEFPELHAELVDEGAEAELQRAISLRHKQVTNVEVLSPWPHLVFTFSDGAVLYLNGRDDQYEPWTAGLGGVAQDQQTQVIACPGGELAFVLPTAL